MSMFKIVLILSNIFYNIPFEVKFKEFEPRLKHETRFRHGWFSLNFNKFFKICNWLLAV